MIIYTSGTTGRPKGAVHSHCGFPIKTAQDMVHCFDVHDGETMYWVSDMGWMMGPWEVFGMTLLGGTIVLYDGALDFPGPIGCGHSSSGIGSTCSASLPRSFAR